MTLEHITIVISGLAFIGSIISLGIANQANKIEKNRDRIDLGKGKTALLNLTSKYFIINLQRTEFHGTKFLVRRDSDYNSNYIDELELIATQFEDLVNSTYFTVLYKKYPMIGTMPIFIRKEIMYIKSYNSQKKQYGFDNVVWERMFYTFEILKNDVKLDNNKWSDILKNEIYQNAKLINDFLNSKN